MNTIVGSYDIDVLIHLGATMVWKKPGDTFDYEGTIDLNQYSSAELQVAKNRKIDEIKKKAYNDITVQYPEWRQLNYIRLNNANLSTMSTFIDNIRTASDSKESEVNACTTIAQIQAVIP